MISMSCTASHRSRIDAGGPKASRKDTARSSGPEWVKKGPRQAAGRALLAAAVSDDGHYLAVGGGDWQVHVWDARSNEYIQVRLDLPVWPQKLHCRSPPSSPCWDSICARLAGACLGQPY